jgi:hypothetical protein
MDHAKLAATDAKRKKRLRSSQQSLAAPFLYTIRVKRLRKAEGNQAELRGSATAVIVNTLVL